MSASKTVSTIYAVQTEDLQYKKLVSRCETLAWTAQYERHHRTCGRH